MAEVVGGEERRYLVLLHEVDDAPHVARRGRDADLRLDVHGAGDPEACREVQPVLVVAHHLAVSEGLPLAQPAAQQLRERLSLEALLLQELPEPVCAGEVEEGLRAEDVHELIAEGPAHHALRERSLVLLVQLRPARVDAAQAGQDVPADDDPVHRVGVDVRIAEHVNVAGRARDGRRHIEQVDAAVSRHMSGSAVPHLRVAGAVEERRNPELQVEAGGHEQVRTLDERREARARVDEMRIHVAPGDRGDLRQVTRDLAGDRRVRREGRDHADLLLRRGPRRQRAGRGQHDQEGRAKPPCRFHAAFGPEVTGATTREPHHQYDSCLCGPTAHMVWKSSVKSVGAPSFFTMLPWRRSRSHSLCHHVTLGTSWNTFGFGSNRFT